MHLKVNIVHGQLISTLKSISKWRKYWHFLFTCLRCPHVLLIFGLLRLHVRRRLSVQN